ncbi:hypothetical protein M422DRAFT_256683 [Sphaerobolus stellatus SS14]|uniref:Uncharacterized protein n=1 Tax=Sphaerobolus stellatus (strain SS14) TaxID=990650 RepID=A0A0C9VQG4_SPHS4|nr:hypothetical protein M422DRAFT_256683 [Sphaerobolus stellatus SS14]
MSVSQLSEVRRSASKPRRKPWKAEANWLLNNTSEMYMEASCGLVMDALFTPIERPSHDLHDDAPRATRIRKPVILDLLASFNDRQAHPIASSCGALLEMDTSAASAQHLMQIHSSSNESLVPKTLPPAPNPFDTTLPTIHHSNVGLQARRRIPYEVAFSRTYHAGFNLGLTRIPFSSRRELH